MKTSFTLFLFAFLAFKGFSQQLPFPGEFLDINNQKQFFTPFGLMGWDGDAPLQHVPKDSASWTIFGGSFWFSGVTPAQDTLTAADRYRSETDWWPGPVMNTQADYVSEAPTYDRVWKINSSDISYHMAHYADPGYVPIEVIANWPGNGNTSLGQAAKLAHFHDMDNDGTYEPLKGDYPLIKGHQAVYAIFNDHRVDETLTIPEISGQPMKVEVHAMAYAFSCPQDFVMDHAYFIDYTIYNRSSTDYHDVYAAQWMDFDLGNPQDDYVGTEVERSAFYAYNGDGNDESHHGTTGYGQKLPIQSTVILEGLPLPNDSEDNGFGIGQNQSINGTGFGDGIVDNERWGLQYTVYHNNEPGHTGDPQTSHDYAHYMRGFWKDGTPLSFGSNGYDPGNTNAIQTRYMYPGYSDTLYNFGTNGISQNAVWTEVTAGNVPGDRRMFGSTGPSVLEADGSVSITVAHVFTQELMIGDSGMALMAQGIDHVRSAYEAGYFECGSFALGTEALKNNATDQPLLFPNPANSKIFTNGQCSDIRLYNLAGALVMEVAGRPMQIDISTLPDGLYIFSANAQGKPIVQRLTVRH